MYIFFNVQLLLMLTVYTALKYMPTIESFLAIIFSLLLPIILSDICVIQLNA